LGFFNVVKNEIFYLLKVILINKKNDD